MATPGDKAHVDPSPPTRAELLRHLGALNGNLARLRVAPLVDYDAGTALPDEELAEAVRLTGRYLVTTARALGSG
jgi:hypothetical protein